MAKRKRQWTEGEEMLFATPWVIRNGVEIYDQEGRLLAICTAPEVARMMRAAPRLKALISILVDWVIRLRGHCDIERSDRHFWKHAQEVLAEADALYEQADRGPVAFGTVCHGHA